MEEDMAQLPQGNWWKTKMSFDGRIVAPEPAMSFGL
jgi:hypothetical protein